MLRNVLKITVRRIRRQSLYALINVVGLALGMMICLLIGLFIYGELRVDRFHKKSDRIVRVGLKANFMMGNRQSHTSYPLANVLEREVPPVQEAVRVRAQSFRLSTGTSSDLQPKQRVLTAGEAFFDIFTFPALHGDPTSALSHSNGIVLTAPTAQKYFGRADAVGQSLTLELRNETRTLTVRAVVEDIPDASTLQFDAVVPIAPMVPESKTGDWGRLMYRTFALLQHPDVDREALSTQIDKVVASKTELDAEYFPTDLPAIYLSPLYETGGFRGDARYLYIFGTIALFVLLIATINYVNLATAQGARRAREVGMRKTMGAPRGRLVWQFLGESVLLSLCALVVALGLTAGALPVFNQLFGTSLTLTSGPTGWAVMGLGGFVVLVSVAAGTYPAFVLSRYDPTRALQRQRTTSTSRGGWLRRALVVFQFAVSAALIVGTIILYQQLQYVQDRDLGFEAERVVTVDLPRAAQDARQALAREARTHPSVQTVSVANGVPGRYDGWIEMAPDRLSSEHDVSRPDSSVRYAVSVVDSNYVDLLGLALVAGGPNDARQSTGRAVLLNESGAEALGWTPEEAVGKPFSFDDRQRRVIGVVDDYHLLSLHQQIMPVALLLGPTEKWSSPYLLAARLASDNIHAGLDHLRRSFSTVAPESSFEYAFLDDTFEEAYRSERRLGRIFGAFALLAILIACMGLFGLAAHAAERRTREIGVRKALGATAMQIVGLVTKEFAVLLAVALVLGTPVAYIGMQWWLQNFAYRIDLGTLPFVATSLGALVLAGLTVSVHAFRAARTDPASTLRDE